MCEFYEKSLDNNIKYKKLLYGCEFETLKEQKSRRYRNKMYYLIILIGKMCLLFYLCSKFIIRSVPKNVKYSQQSALIAYTINGITNYGHNFGNNHSFIKWNSGRYV